MSHHTNIKLSGLIHNLSIHLLFHHRSFSITGVLESIPASLGERQDTPGTDHHTNVNHQPNPDTVEGRKVQPVFTVNCAAQVTVLP